MSHGRNLQRMDPSLTNPSRPYTIDAWCREPSRSFVARPDRVPPPSPPSGHFALTMAREVHGTRCRPAHRSRWSIQHAPRRCRRRNVSQSRPTNDVWKTAFDRQLVGSRPTDMTVLRVEHIQSPRPLHTVERLRSLVRPVQPAVVDRDQMTYLSLSSNLNRRHPTSTMQKHPRKRRQGDNHAPHC